MTLFNFNVTCHAYYDEIAANVLEGKTDIQCLI